MSTFSTHANYHVERIGNERQPIVLIDNFSSQFSDLVVSARLARYVAGGNHYPGQRAAAPPSYLGENAALLKSILIDVFGMTRGAELVECNFSIVTTPPEQLSTIQRLPHFDGTDPFRLALLHYFEDERQGGTSFYRHTSTGYETITEDRLQHYDSVLHQEFDSDGVPQAAYFSGSNKRFERIAQFPSRPNRMLIYRGITLHSGDILRAPHTGISIADARLTVNTFLAGRT